MYQLHCDQWHELGAHLGLTEDQLEEAKKGPHPTADILLAAKVRDIDLRWVHIVEALLHVGEYGVAEKIYKEQGVCVCVCVCVCTGTCQHGSYMGALGRHWYL